MTVQHPEYPGAEIQVHYEMSGFPPTSEACAVIFVRDSNIGTSNLQDALVAQTAAQVKALQGFTPFLERTLVTKAYLSHQSSGRGKCASNLPPHSRVACYINFRLFPETQ